MRIAVATLALLLSLALGARADAGGWAVTTLDSVPDAFDPGATYAIGFTIRQHGVTPVDLAGVSIAIVSASGERTSFPAARDGAVGHYRASVAFPAAGEWKWQVIQGPFGAQDLGTVQVRAPVNAVPQAAQAAVAPPARRETDPLLVTGLLLALCGAAVLFGDRVARVMTPARA